MSATHGADVIKFFHASHPPNKNCAGCEANCSAVALTSLAYTFEACDCGHVPYVHLVEHLWHKGCLVDHLSESGARNPMGVPRG